MTTNLKEALKTVSHSTTLSSPKLLLAGFSLSSQASIPLSFFLLSADSLTSHFKEKVRARSRNPPITLSPHLPTRQAQWPPSLLSPPRVLDPISSGFQGVSLCILSSTSSSFHFPRTNSHQPKSRLDY